LEFEFVEKNEVNFLVVPSMIMACKNTNFRDEVIVFLEGYLTFGTVNERESV